MATAPNPVKPAAAKYETFVESQLRRAQLRIRILDTGSALLLFLAAGLAFLIGMTLADHWLGLTPTSRLLALAGFVLFALACLGVGVLRPWLRQVNPYYAALQVEHTLPDAKNSVVNWLDLHDHQLPGAIRQAVVQKAAKDMGQVDLEQAISARRVLLLGVAVGGLFGAAFAAMLWLGPPQFFSRMGRVLSPFGEGRVATQTRLTILRPDGGDATVPAGRAVQFLVRVEGRVPARHQSDAVRLCYRYGLDEKGYQERLLEAKSDHDWMTSLSDTEIQDGFWYKVKGGDVETPEYHVLVRPSPIAEPVKAVYEYRPYFRPLMRTVLKPPELDAWRGTRVTLEARANYPVKDAGLELNLGGKEETIPGVVDPASPETITFQFVLDQDGKQSIQNGKYGIRFTTTSGEPSAEPTRSLVLVRRDEVPVVTLDQPDKDITLPANALLEVMGTATDDIGVRDVRLLLQVVGGPRLHAKTYRPEKSFRLDDGSYPTNLAYRDFVELAKVTDTLGKPFALKANMEIEYWLEATDACDYPEPRNGQTGASAHRKVKLTEPTPNQAKRDKEQKQASERQQEHNKQQDEQLKQQNQARNKDGAGSPNQQPQPGDKKDSQGAQSGKPEDQSGGQQDQGDNKPQKPDGQSGNKDGSSGQSQDKSGEGEGNLDKKLQEAIDRKPSADRSGEGKEPAGENKPAGDPGKQPDKAEGKGNSERQSRPDAAQEKDAGGKPGAEQSKAGAGKEQGQPQADQQPGAGKASSQADNSGGAAKDDGQPEQQPDRAEGKDQGQGQAADGQQPAESKEAVKGQGDGTAPAQKKDQGQRANAEKGAGQGEAKGDPTPAQSEAKAGGADKPGAEQDKAAAKKEGPFDGGEHQTKGDPKPAPAEKGQGEEVARAEKKSDGQGSSSKDAKELEERLQKERPLSREELKQKLEELSRTAEDPQVRQTAAQALDEMRKQERDAAQGKTAPSQPKEGTGTPDQAKAPGNEERTPQGERGAKPGNEPGSPKDQGQGKRGDGPRGTPDPTREPGQGNGKTEGGQGKEPGNGDPGSGVGSPRTPGTAKGSPKETANSPDHHHEAGDLQLEQFRTWVDKDVLKSLNLTPEQFRKYLEAKKKAIAAQPPLKGGPEDKPEKIERTGALPDYQADRQQGIGQTGGINGNLPGEAPPGFREGDREYTARRANLQKKTADK